MLNVLGQMAVLILVGVLWRVFSPLGLDADRTRQAITGLVFVVLLPALVLLVLWRAPLGVDTLWIAGVAAGGVGIGVGASWLLYRWMGLARPVIGTLILASAWPNATYLGLPVLESTLGHWARSVALQFDLFACTPLLLTAGVLIARAHGEDHHQEPTWRALLRVPPLWAALLGTALNLGGVPMNPWVEGVLERLGPTVPPLMLIALGMGLRWDTIRPRQIGWLIPVLGIQLLLIPLAAFAVTAWGGVAPDLRTAIVLESAMPAMVLGVVLCDRYRLDPGLYAAAVTLTTLASLVTLPLWLGLLAA